MLKIIRVLQFVSQRLLWLEEEKKAHNSHSPRPAVSVSSITISYIL